MSLKSNRQVTSRILLILVFVFSFFVVKGQTFLNPVSFWVFSPYIYNPAIVGSKDFLSVNLDAAFLGTANTQIISENSRITKTRSGYFSSPEITEFRNIGSGVSFYNDFDGLSRKVGLSTSLSYHIPLNTRKLSFLSVGISVKGEYNTVSSVAQRLSGKTFYANMDIGIYYYGTNFFTGFSEINMRGSPWNPDILEVFKLPVSREYFFTAGYKFLLSRSLNIVLEPSVLFVATDSTFRKTGNNINPVIKLYLDDYCIGTAFNSDGRISFFGQFRYPRFYVGAFYEFARKTAFYINKPTIEFNMGINIQNDKTRITKHSHW
jgi:type IX secretion system PorP/SprF family membrane protein